MSCCGGSFFLVVDLIRGEHDGSLLGALYRDDEWTALSLTLLMMLSSLSSSGNPKGVSNIVEIDILSVDFAQKNPYTKLNVN